MQLTPSVVIALTDSFTGGEGQNEEIQNLPVHPGLKDRFGTAGTYRLQKQKNKANMMMVFVSQDETTHPTSLLPTRHC